MDAVAAWAGWRSPEGISYGQRMEAKQSKKPDIAPASPTILTVREVSERLRLHPTTIYRLLRLNQIPAFRVGSDWRFNTDMIDRWMSAGQQAAMKVPIHDKQSG
jgi:excisionase family DNA binding protein